MKLKPSLEEDINSFLEVWDCKQQIDFLKDIIPLFELYDVDDENDWVRDVVGELNERNVRLIRTVYLVSIIAENHAGILCSIKMKFKNIFKRMQKDVIDVSSNVKEELQEMR